MIKHKKDSKREMKKEIRNSLAKSSKKGVQLYLCGELSNPSEISDITVREDGCYMADYVTDDDGCLVEIRFDKVSY